MQPIALLALVACALTLLLTPLVRVCSIAAGWVDSPDDRRKLHLRAVPRTGGIAILVSYAASFGALFLVSHGGGIIGRHLATIFRLLPGVAIVFTVGLLDDRLNLKPWHKLAAEIAGAVWMYAAGVRIVVSGHSGAWSFLLTVGWLILCANAFNLIDGVDGLAAGVGLTATLTTFAAALLHGDLMLGLVTAPLAGALLGFLRYNFNPASIFLGDSGSLSIGFLLGTYAVVWSEKSATLLGLAAPAMALALPLLEVALSVMRRFLRNEPIFAGDRGHIHHRLLDRGFTPRRVALLLYAAGGVAAVLALLQSYLAALLFAVAAWVGIRYLAYAEFRAVARFIRTCLRPLLGAQVHIEVLERSLAAASGAGDCWQAIESAGRALGYGRVEARLNGIRFSTGGPRRREVWQMRVSLPAGDYVNITHFAGEPESPRVLAAFVDVITGALPRRLISSQAVCSLPRPTCLVAEAVSATSRPA